MHSSSPSGPTVWIALSGKLHKVVLPAAGDSASTYATVDGKPIPVDIHMLQPGVLSLLLTQPNGTVLSFRCIADEAVSADADPAVLIAGQRFSYAVSDPRSLRASSATVGDTGPRALKSPMPGRIVRVLVAAGETVVAGQGCIVIEAMKMQNELKAPKAGRIAKLTAAAGETVLAGATLLVVE